MTLTFSPLLRNSHIGMADEDTHTDTAAQMASTYAQRQIMILALEILGRKLGWPKGRPRMARDWTSETLKHVDTGLASERRRSH